MRITKKDMQEKGRIELSYQEIRDIQDYMFQSSFESRKRTGIRYDKLFNKINEKERELLIKIQDKIKKKNES